MRAASASPAAAGAAMPVSCATTAARISSSDVGRQRGVVRDVDGRRCPPGAERRNASVSSARPACTSSASSTRAAGEAPHPGEQGDRRAQLGAGAVRPDRYGRAVEPRPRAAPAGWRSPVRRRRCRRGRRAPPRPRPRRAGRGRRPAPAGSAGASASSSRAISVSGTIELSSTTTTSKGRWFSASCRNRLATSGRLAEQPVQGAGAEPVEERRGRRRAAPPAASRTAFSSRAAALPVGRGERHPQPGRRGAGAAPRPAAPPSSVLPVPGPPAITLTAGQRGHRHRAALVGGVRVREQLGEVGPQPTGSMSSGAVGAAGQQVVGDAHLLAPVPVQPQPGADHAQRRAAGGAGDERAGRARLDPPGGLGPGQRDGLGGGAVGRCTRRRPGRRRPRRCRRQVARSKATDPCRVPRTVSATASRTRSSVSPVRAPSRWATWTSAAASRPGSSNSASRPVRPRRARELGHDAPPASRSEVAVISAAGGCQAKTPGRLPSAAGATSGPHMPRRNR